jgi:hypothetical protein
MGDGLGLYQPQMIKMMAGSSDECLGFASGTQHMSSDVHARSHSRAEIWRS